MPPPEAPRPAKGSPAAPWIDPFRRRGTACRSAAATWGRASAPGTPRHGPPYAGSTGPMSAVPRRCRQRWPPWSARRCTPTATRAMPSGSPHCNAGSRSPHAFGAGCYRHRKPPPAAPLHRVPGCCAGRMDRPLAGGGGQGAAARRVSLVAYDTPAHWSRGAAHEFVDPIFRRRLGKWGRCTQKLVVCRHAALDSAGGAVVHGPCNTRTRRRAFDPSAFYPPGGSP